MQACPWNFLNDGQKHIISLVGGGGKTTIMYELAAYFAKQGRRVVCLTTTHILQPKVRCSAWLLNAGSKESQPIYAKNMEQVGRLWQLGRYAVLGTAEENTGKLVQPEEELLQLALASSEIALIEADGAKHMPCKVPNEKEPVLLPESDIVIAVAGMDALGNTLEEVCFRWQLGSEIFASSCNALLDEAKLARLLLSQRGARKQVGSRSYYIALNKCDLVSKEQALAMRNLLMDQGMESARIWLRNLRF